MTKPKAPQSREDRLKKALRDNLRRRKAASRKPPAPKPDKEKPKDS